MSDEAFREVQLTGKKLVFVCMVGAVVLVVVFLLGVMVGRGVPSRNGSADALPTDASIDKPAGEPGAIPPPTKPSAGDLDYAALVGGGDPKKAIEPPATPADSSDAAASTTKPDAATSTTKPDATAKTQAPPPVTPPAKAAALPKTDAAPAPSTTGQWIVQVNAFSKKAAADNFAASLQKKSYTAFVAHDGALYHVQVGPFADRAEAERTRAQLQKEGFKPLIKR